MASDLYAISELTEESWEHRLKRLCEETRDLVAATRKEIRTSHLAIQEADRLLERH